MLATQPSENDARRIPFDLCLTASPGDGCFQGNDGTSFAPVVNLETHPLEAKTT